MQMHASFPDETRFVRVQLTGAWNVDDYPGVIDAIIEECETRRQNLLLIDFLELGWDRVSTFDRFRMGTGAVTLAWKVSRLAALARPDQIDPERFGERVARNRGLNVRLFTDPQEAERWLLNGD